MQFHNSYKRAETPELNFFHGHTCVKLKCLGKRMIQTNPSKFDERHSHKCEDVCNNESLREQELGLPHNAKMSSNPAVIASDMLITRLKVQVTNRQSRLLVC